MFYCIFHLHGITFLSFPFSRCVSLALKWVFCKQHIDFFHVKMHSFSFWLEHLIHLHWKWLLISMSLMQFCYLYPGCFVVLLFSLSFSFRCFYWHIFKLIYSFSAECSLLMSLSQAFFIPITVSLISRNSFSFFLKQFISLLTLLICSFFKLLIYLFLIRE